MGTKPNRLLKLPVCLVCASLMAAAFITSGCSPAKKTQPDSQITTSSSETTYTSGIVNGYSYTLLRPQEYGPDLWRGWYIRDTEEEKYIMICNGRESTGGYCIQVTSVAYDQANDMIIITVQTTRDPEIVTDAYTHPCCSVKLDKIPDNVKVVLDTGDEIEFGGKIIDTKNWAVDVAIDDDYTAVFTDGGHTTIIYKTSDGKYKYINALFPNGFKGDTTADHLVKGRGTAPTIDYVDYLATRFGSKGYVLEKGSSEKIKTEDYLESVRGPA